MMHNFKELKIWQQAMVVAEEVYRLTNAFPIKEQFGLTSQLRRAVISIPSNIAEGAGRSTNRDFSRFLDITNGSINEVETQLLLATRLGMLESEKKLKSIFEKLDAIQKMVFSFQKTLKA